MISLLAISALVSDDLTCFNAGKLAGFGSAPEMMDQSLLLDRTVSVMYNQLSRSFSSAKMRRFSLDMMWANGDVGGLNGVSGGSGCSSGYQESFGGVLGRLGGFRFGSGLGV